MKKLIFSDAKYDYELVGELTILDNYRQTNLKHGYLKIEKNQFAHLFLESFLAMSSIDIAIEDKLYFFEMFIILHTEEKENVLNCHWLSSDIHVMKIPKGETC